MKNKLYYILIILAIFLTNLMNLDEYSNYKFQELNDIKTFIEIAGTDTKFLSEIEGVAFSVDQKCEDEMCLFITEEYRKNYNISQSDECFYEKDNFYLYGQNYYCPIELIDTSVKYVEIGVYDVKDIQKITDVLDQNNIEYEVVSTMYSLGAISFSFVIYIMIFLLILIFIFDSQKYLKEKALLKLNGYSNLNILLMRSKDIFFSILIGIIVFLVFDFIYISTKTNVNEFFNVLSYIYIEMIFVIFAILISYMIINLLALRVDILGVIKGKVHKNLILVLIFIIKVSLSFLLVFSSVFLIVEVLKLKSDYQNQGEWEKYKDFYYLQISHDDISSDFILDNYSEIMYYSHGIPEDYQDYNDTCNDPNNIRYGCYEVFASKLFFKNLKLKDIEIDKYDTDILVVLPPTFWEEQSKLEERYQMIFGESYSISFVEVDDLEVYSYNTRLNILHNDYVINPYLVVDLKGNLPITHYETSNMYVEYEIYENYDRNNGSLVLYENILDDYNEYIKVATMFVAVIACIVIIVLVFLIFINNYYINQTINFTIQKSILLKTNGFSKLDIYYFIYGLTVLTYLISIFTTYLYFRLLYDIKFLILGIGLILMIIDIIIINKRINRIENGKIIEFLKGGQI